MTQESGHRVLVVYDQELVRAGFALILQRGGMEVVGEVKAVST